MTKNPFQLLSKKILIIILSLIISFSACKDDEEPEPIACNIINLVPEFYKKADENNWGQTQPLIVKISSSSSRISKPTDLDFNPNREGELWVVNEGIERTGGSTVMITDLNTDNPKYDYRKDQNSWHFMSLTTGIAFGENGLWATSPGVLDANHRNSNFTGPSLWSANLDVYAKPSGGNGSHMDMLHGSPYSMGIAWEKDNVYWVFDGFNEHLCRYDFAHDHGPGNSDHDDGVIQRFTNINLKKNSTIPSHLVLDKGKEFVYVVNGGDKKVFKVDLATSNKIKSLPMRNEILADHSEWKADYKIISDGLFNNYCGIAINEDRLFLSDYDDGDIVCLDLKTNEVLSRVKTKIKGITGLAIHNNQIYFVSYLENALYKIELP